MSDADTVSRPATEEVVAALLERPPETMGELRWRLSGCDVEVARGQLVSALEAGLDDDDAREALVDALVHLGAEGFDARLKIILLDKARALYDRVAALSVAMDAAPDEVPLWLSETDDSDLQELVEASAEAPEPVADANQVPVGAGYGLLSAIAPDGSYVVGLVLKQPAGTSSVVLLTVSVDGGPVDGIWVPTLEPHEHHRLLQSIVTDSGLVLAEVSIARAAADALTAGRRGTATPDGAAALRVFQRAATHHDPPEPIELPEPHSPTDEELAGLLRRPEHTTWRLPDDEEPSSPADLATHMAHFHAHAGDPEAAAFCLGLAQAPDRLADAMRAAPAEAPLRPISIGSPSFRATFRRESFGEVDNPTGHDLAHLDFTEATYWSLSGMLGGAPTELKPSETVIRQVAHAFGVGFADFIGARLAGRDDAPQPHGALLEALFEETDLPPRMMAGIAVQLTVDLQAFLTSVCAACPIRCLEHLPEDHGERFFHPEHPADLALDEGLWLPTDEAWYAQHLEATRRQTITERRDARRRARKANKKRNKRGRT